MSETDSHSAVERLGDLRALHHVDEFLVVERMFSEDPANTSFGIANIHPVVNDIAGNKAKILRAVRIFKERKANIVLFPEFCLSGYFWDDFEACREYMNGALLDEHFDWIEREIKPLLDDHLREIVLNGLVRGDGKFFNTTVLIDRDFDHRRSYNHYHKVFLPEIEKAFTHSGQADRMVLDGEYGRFGFTTCYDYLFSELLREYAFDDHVDAVLQTACWRAVALRDYPGMNVRTDQYYGDLWDMVIPAYSAVHQVWTIACNAVGKHEISGQLYWGGSGVWAPSGLKLLQASHLHEELLIVHNLDIRHQRRLEQDDYNYAFDFEQVYRPMKGVAVHSRMPEAEQGE